MKLALQTVGELVTQDYRRAGVFKRYGIDFCCGGGKTLQAACEERGVALGEVEQALQATDRSAAAAPMRPDSWAPDFLASYIVNVHHAYVRESIPSLQAFTRKVARVHGGANPEVVEIARLFGEIASELSQHMAEEEGVLFPYVEALVATRKEGREPERPAFGAISDSIEAMVREHERAGEIMQEIRRLSSGFMPPEHACTTYRASYAKLEEFEENLHRHVHLENNVLFPKAAALETA